MRARHPRQTGTGTGSTQIGFGSGGLAQRLTAQLQGDRGDRLAPVAGLRRCSGHAKRRQRVGRSAAVAEDPRTGLAREADGLVPLQGIDVIGSHRFRLTDRAAALVWQVEGWQAYPAFGITTQYRAM